MRYLLGAVGIGHPPLWLSDPDIVVPTLVAVDAWMWTPMVALICIAGLAALPPEPFEAALVDGASALQRFRYLTLPMMLPTLMVAAMLRVMDLLKLIDIVYVMTGGGPGHLSETINLYNYLAALSYDKIGYGSAIALVLFAIVIACTLVLIWLRQAGLVRRRLSPQRRRRLGFAVAGWTVTFMLVCAVPVDGAGLVQDHRRLPGLPAGLRVHPDARQLSPGAGRQFLPALHAEQHHRGGGRHGTRPAAGHSRRLRAGALAPHRHRRRAAAGAHGAGYRLSHPAVRDVPRAASWSAATPA